MTIQDAKARWLDENTFPRLIGISAAADTLYYGGHVGGVDAAGNAAMDLNCVSVFGMIEGRTDNRLLSSGNPNAGYGAVGAITVPVRPGVHFFASDGTVTQATRGYVYLLSAASTTAAATITAAPPAGAPLLGYLVPAIAKAGTPDAGLFAVAIGMARPDIADPIATIPTCRAVITSIAAYVGTGTGTLTASATGAIGAQDGATLFAGDRVILPVITGGAGGATVAADSGPYIVTSPGATGVKFVLTRPPEWAHGALIGEATTFRIGEGTLWAGNDWRAFPTTAAKVIGTDDPHFWPRTYSADLTVAGANTTFWLRNVLSIAGVNITGANAWWASTLTAGAGNGAVTITGTSSQHIYFTAINF